jgi:hypothetical protein
VNRNRRKEANGRDGSERERGIKEENKKRESGRNRTEPSFHWQ